MKLRLTTVMVRAAVTIATIAITALALWVYIQTLNSTNGINWLEWISIPLFATLSAWIVFSFCLATLGFVARSGRTNIARTDMRSASNQRRTAILMPIYNESPECVMAGVESMILALDRLGIREQFAFYILSDTTKPEIWLAEEFAWDQLVEKLNAKEMLFYRHRPDNVSRKAGNISDFVERWGSLYEYMLVLDADSLMDGATIDEMVRRMNQDSSLGILQVAPIPIGRSSLFARLQQFSASVYGPVFVNGFAIWSGRQGNYWGHNAIIRVEAFRSCCSLPVLSGKAPLGGEILSHDFVEAALMVRNGWTVQLATDLVGSYEECPTTIADFAQRDQRWCQGNLQHSKLILNDGLHPLSRMHLTSGVMAYCASPLWVLFTLACIGGMWLDRSTSAQVLQWQGLSYSLWIFVGAMSLLLIPKLWGTLKTGLDATRLKQHGGWANLFAGALLEIICSVLLSPIMAVFHSRFVLSVLSGMNVKWNAQQRNEHAVTWAEATEQFRTVMLSGILMTLVLAWYSPALLPWFSPILAGLVFSIPIAVAMGSQTLGNSLRRLGLLLIPAETEPDQLVRDHQTAVAWNQHAMPQYQHGLLAELIRNPKLFALHCQIQDNTNAHVELPIHQRKAIEAAFASGGASEIPENLKKPLLLDVKTLKRLHVESQLQLITS